VAEQSDEGFAFPEPPEGLIKAPENSVIALLDGPDEVEAAIGELTAEGFEPDRISVLCGPKGAERLDVSGRHHGLRGRIYRLVERIGDQRELLVRAGDHLAAGGLLLMVPADDSQKAAAARILGRHGGHDMAHFGRGHWEPLGA
jgi:hypothetical protein